MKQQLDFLKSLPKTSVQLPTLWIVVTTIFTLGLVISTSVIMGIQQIELHYDIERAVAKHIEATAALQQTEKSNPLLASGMRVVDQIDGMEKELKAKKDYYANLTRLKLRAGFSKDLQAFSKAGPEGLWLTQMVIDQGGLTDLGETGVWLRGYMLRPSIVSTFLQALQKSPVFTGTTFRLFYAKKPEGKSYTEFKITNAPLTADGEMVKDPMDSGDSEKDS